MMIRLGAAGLGVIAMLGVASVAAPAWAESPPSTPQRLTPVGGDHLFDGPVRFTWQDALDPQSLPLRYEVEVTEVVAGNKSARRVAQVTGRNGSVGVLVEGLPWGPLSWRIRAVNSDGLTSAWSEPPSQFTVQSPAAPDSPVAEADGNAPGCDVARRGARPVTGLASLFAFALAGCALRRSRRAR